MIKEMPIIKRVRISFMNLNNNSNNNQNNTNTKFTWNYFTIHSYKK